MTKKIQRNDPCPCGSGAKYKKCCGLKERELKQKKGLKGHFATNLSGSMKDMAGRVFKVLTATAQPPASHGAKEQPGILSSSETPRGYRTLEELIGMKQENPRSDSSCCTSEGHCCCHDERAHSS